MNRSPERNTFQLKAYLERCEADGEEPNENYIELYRADGRDLEKEQNEEWKKDNLEYDLRSNKWICDKVKASDSYAQNVYASLCNREWQKNDVMPILKDQTWGCSWRYAGGIVADMIEKGDYIDWYCSGIRGDKDIDYEAALERDLDLRNYVNEGHVTDEIREDFFKLGWIPIYD